LAYAQHRQVAEPSCAQWWNRSVGGGMVVEERGTWSRAPRSRRWHSMSYRRPITPEMAHYAAIRAAASWLVGYVLDGNQHTFVVQSATKGEAEPAYQHHLTNLNLTTMAHPHPLPVGERNSSPIHPDFNALRELGGVNPRRADVSNLDLKSYCTGFDAHYGSTGPGEILLPLLDDTNIYSLAMPLPHETSYKALEGTMFKNEEAGGAYQQCHEASPNFLFSTSVGYESSLSPSSSRPCTAGYEVDGTSFSSSAAEPPLPLLYGCGFSPTEGSSFYSHFDQTAIEAKASAKFAPAINHNTFPLQYMPPYLIQQSNGLIGPQEEMNTMLDPPVDLQFPTVSTTTHCNIPIDMPEKYPWSTALSHPPRSGMDGTFAHSEVFTTTCVQPTSLVSHQAVNGKPKGSVLESSHGAYGKASFLPGNWETQGIFSDENIKYSPQPLKRGAAEKRRPKRKNPATEILPKNDSTGTKFQGPITSPSRGFDPPGPEDPTKRPTGSADNKTPDGKYICSRIAKDTQEVCGRKFQRSEHLKRHWATHDDLKPFQCPKCERFFGRTDNLTQHIKTHDNAHGRNTKLLKAKQLQSAENNKGLQKIERKPTDYSSRVSRRRKIQQHS
ncbi:hypothetical protein PSTT_07888, partial [Puccinia striiformis]